MMPKKFCEIKNQTETTADLYFYGDIVSDWYGAWQEEDQYPEAIKNFLNGAEGKDLNVYINSGGGSVFAGIAIYNMLKRHGQKNTVKVFVDGLAGSIASVIAFAGTEPPTIPSNAFMMIHNPWASVCGNAEELRKMAEDLEQVKVGILNTYEEHLQDEVDIGTIEKLMAEETWLTGKEAANYFKVNTTEEKEIAAAVGDYLNRANIPKELLEKKNSTSVHETSKDDVKEEEKRNKLKRMVIKNMKGE